MARKIHIKLEALPGMVDRDIKRLQRQKLQAALMATGKYTVRALRDTSRKTDPRPRATSAYEKGWQLKPGRGVVRVVNDTKQAYFVEHGRRPGPAPFAPFLAWARAKMGMAVLGAGDVAAKNRVEQLAFLAWRKVMRKGTPARKVVARTMPRVNKYLRRQIRKALKTD